MPLYVKLMTTRPGCDYLVRREQLKDARTSD